MRKTKYLIILLSLLFINNIYSQKLDTIFNGYLSPIVQTGGSSPSFNFQAAFHDDMGTFDGTEVTTDAVLIMESDGRCYKLTIDTLTATGSIISGTVIDSTGELAAIPSGTAAIVRRTSNRGLYPIPTGLPVSTEGCIHTVNYQIMDTIAANISAGSLAFDGNRNILRVPTAGQNLGTASIGDWLEWWYFTAPTLSLSLSPTTTVYEVGDTSYITVSGTTTNSGGATLSNGDLQRTNPSATSVDAFGTGTSHSFAFSFAPQKDSTTHYKQLTYSFQADQDWVFGAESGTASSTTRTVTAVYPILYGMSNVDFSAGGDPYTTDLTKLVQAEGNKTVTLTGSGYIYYAIPKTWGDYTLSSIIDHNGFNVTASFTAYDITVSSTGLINDWTSVDYKLYKLNTTTTTSGYAYIFNR